MSEVEIYNDGNFTVQVEEQEGIMFLHCQAEEFSKSIWKQMKVVMEEIKLASAAHGWEEMFTYTRNGKFARLLGAEPIDKFELRGEEYEVMRWPLL